MARTWGVWTRNKLDILSAYLAAFTIASSRKARGTTVYLDLFVANTCCSLLYEMNTFAMRASLSRGF